MPAAARIVGAGMTAMYKSQPRTAVELMVQALQLAVDDTRGLLTMRDIDTLIALPSLMSEQHFMIGHAVAQQVGFRSVPVAGFVGQTPGCIRTAHHNCSITRACLQLHVIKLWCNQ
jgi:hypothetical protein